MIVQTTSGLIQGAYTSCYFSFKGIPYAEPPVGDLRFSSPVPHKKWTEVRNATEHGSFCANKFGFFGLTQQAGGSEDCLFLNVYTPNLKGKLAVMFWIHGGAFMSGNGDTLLYGPEHLVHEDVVLVTINHRYSAFGFLSTADENVPGNQGMKDIVLALKWVHDNIENFGGDAEKVTIFGHSAGSTAVNYIMLSEMAKGLFHQAIMQSGSSLSPCLFQPDPKPKAENLGRKLGLQFNSTKELVEKLREVDYKAIVDAETPLFEIGTPWGLQPFDFLPSADFASLENDKFLSEFPENIFLSKNFQNIPMMIGSPSLEGMFVALLLSDPNVLELYNQNPEFIVPLSFNLQPNSAELNEAIKELQMLYFGGRATGTLEEWLTLYTDKVFRFPSDRAIRFYAESSTHSIYLYEFTFDGSLNYFKKFFNFKFDGVSHSDELFYLFEPGLPGFVPDTDSSLVRRRMTKMWTNFAKFGYKLISKIY